MEADIKKSAKCDGHHRQTLCHELGTFLRAINPNSGLCLIRCNGIPLLTTVRGTPGVLQLQYFNLP
jgi:hypothetical protein